VMESFPVTLLDELRSVFSTVPVVIDEEGTRSSDLADAHSLESIAFRNGSDRRFIDIHLKYRSGKRVVVTLSSEDFSESIEEIPGRPNLSQLAYFISILATEWLFGRENEEGFPAHVYLRPYKTMNATTIQVELSLDSGDGEAHSIRVDVLLDGTQVGVLTDNHELGYFVVQPRDVQLQVIIDGRFVSNEVISTRLAKRSFACRVEGDLSTPTVSLVYQPCRQRTRSQYPPLFSMSSEEKHVVAIRQEALRAESAAALGDAAGMLSEASIDEDFQGRGWSRRLADDLAKECERLRWVLEETGEQLPQRLGDLGLERWLRAYVPSAAGSDRLQDAVLRASGALKALTAAGDE
jgi:hypothetical protein